MDYIKHPLEKRAFKNPEVYKKPVGEMEGVTSYKNEYIGEFSPISVQLYFILIMSVRITMTTPPPNKGAAESDI